ncbi:MAG: DUF1127 domain-containing protein [Rhodospirillales bacterium]|nr:DUF1127 domain-containing protein [Rhodospirillales bacterium]
MNRTLLPRLLGALRRWHHRRLAIRTLWALDDRLLRDIGLDRNGICSVVDGRLMAAASERERQVRTTRPAQAPTSSARPRSALPAGIHGPAARHWPKAFWNATGAKDETQHAVPAANER